MSNQWFGTENPCCDFCGASPFDTGTFIDGRTNQGPWCIMCRVCWDHYGCGQYGTGCAQRYQRHNPKSPPQDAVWLKVIG